MAQAQAALFLGGGGSGHALEWYCPARGGALRVLPQARLERGRLRELLAPLDGSVMRLGV